MAEKLEWVGDVLWDSAGAPVAALRTADGKPPRPDSAWSYTVHGYPGTRGGSRTRELAVGAVERFLAGEAPAPAAEPPASQALRDRVQAKLDEVRKEIRARTSKLVTYANDLGAADNSRAASNAANLLQIAERTLHLVRGVAMALEEVLNMIDGKEEA